MVCGEEKTVTSERVTGRPRLIAEELFRHRMWERKPKKIQDA